MVSEKSPPYSSESSWASAFLAMTIVETKELAKGCVWLSRFLSYLQTPVPH